MCKRRQWPHHCSGVSHRRKFLRHDVEGRANGAGTIFRIALGLAPFVKTVQAAGKAGDPIIILGNNLTGSTGVTFNGTAATFSVVSATDISAAIPTGATTGKIQVVTPTNSLSSNVAFTVLP